MPSEEQTETTEPNNDRQMGWLVFNEKPVMLQLREPYIGCTYSYQPSVDKENGGVRATPVLSGVLLVQPNGNGGTMLVLKMPTGNDNDFALVTIDPRDVVYATHIHQSRIVTQ